MPFSREEYLERLKEVRDLWQKLGSTVDYGRYGYTNPIQGLKKMEANTIMVRERDPAMVDKGWHRLPALDGYSAWLKAFQVLDPTLTDQNNRALDRASGVLKELRGSFNYLGENPSSQQIDYYTQQKMEQLRTTGETYMLTGHREHFNITRIRQLPDGSYSYTLYDSGHETRVVDIRRDENGERRSIVNAVEERRFARGYSPEDVIRADIRKLTSDDDSRDYKQAKSFIDTATNGEVLRVEREYGQRRGNCTTRGQRILIGDIVNDERVSTRLRNFINDDDVSVRDVTNQLAKREQDVLHNRAIPIERVPAPAEQWADYKSSAFGESMRYGKGFASNVDNNEITPEMQRFADEMHGRGVRVQWGWKGDTAYAYVPKHDGQSVDNLKQHMAEGHRQNFAVATEEAASRGVWQSMSNDSGTDVRLDVTNVPDDQRRAWLKKMQDSGIKAEPYHSNTFNRDFIRVRDEAGQRAILDAQQAHLPRYIQAMGQPETVINREGQREYRISVEGRSEHAIGMMQQVLGQAGIKAELYHSPSSHTTSLRTSDPASMQRLADMQRRPPSSAAHGNDNERASVPEWHDGPTGAAQAHGAGNLPLAASPAPPPPVGRAAPPPTQSLPPQPGTQASQGQTQAPQTQNGSDTTAPTQTQPQSQTEQHTPQPQPAPIAGPHGTPPSPLPNPHELPPPQPHLPKAPVAGIMGGAAMGGVATHINRIGGTAGVALGVYGLTQKFGRDGSYTQDAKTDKGLANAGVAADVGAITAGTLEIAGEHIGALSKATKFAGPAGAVLGVASGAIETGIAMKKNDGHRAARAIGGTVGGLGGAIAGAEGGALLGAAVGSIVPGVGTVIGGAVGGVVGGLVGGFAGAWGGAAAGDAVGGHQMQSFLNSKSDQAHGEWQYKLRTLEQKVRQGGHLSAEEVAQLKEINAEVQKDQTYQKDLKLDPSQKEELQHRDKSLKDLGTMQGELATINGQTHGALGNTPAPNQAQSHGVMLDKYALQGLEKAGLLKHDNDTAKEISALGELLKKSGHTLADLDHNGDKVVTASEIVSGLHAKNTAAAKVGTTR